MAKIGWLTTTTETTDASGFIAEVVVPGTFSISGLTAQTQTGAGGFCKVNQSDTRKFTVRVYDRDGSGALTVTASTQVRVLLAALTND